MGDELLKPVLAAIDEGPEPGADLTPSAWVLVPALGVEDDRTLGRLDAGLAAESEHELLADVEPSRLLRVVLLEGRGEHGVGVPQVGEAGRVVVLADEHDIAHAPPSSRA